MKNIFSLELAVFFLLILFFPVHLMSREKIVPGQFRIISENTIAAVTDSMGFIISEDNGKSWTQRNNGLPLKVVYPFTGNEYRKFTSLYVDPLNPSRMAVTDSSSVFITLDSGWNWEKVLINGVVKKSNYFTAISLDPHNENRIILGTSFNGIFETNDKGKHWNKYPADLKLLYRGAGFYEEISGLGIDPENNGKLYIAAGFSGGLYTSESTNEHLSISESSDFVSTHTIRGFKFNGEELGLYTGDGYFYSRYGDSTWKSYIPLFVKNTSVISPAEISRISIAADRIGLYVNSFHASGEDLDNHISFMKKHGLNSMVVDMKDDEGKITYDTSLKLPLALGAVRKRIDIKLLLEKAKANDIYVIARIVVFKDPMLYRFSDSSYAIWDSKEQAPWGNLTKQIDKDSGEESFVQREFWVDPFSEFVWSYNVAIAQELQSLGVDEIQFDYIRFPSDGDMSSVQFRSKRPGMSKIDALESFMRVAREKVFIPISTDLYGFNSWYRMGNWIGQNIEMLADYVDVISPMFYPSHFLSSFHGDLEYLDRAEYIYREGPGEHKLLLETGH
ncbi:MAG: hypothetical protein J7L71_08225 [Spirochaetaceae bacterium]|nr:hypothetical protein [Spirochaetaceae bacterium]